LVEYQGLDPAPERAKKSGKNGSVGSFKDAGTRITMVTGNNI